MKNIIYGLGDHFWKNLEHLSCILEDTIALCDADKSKAELAELLSKPSITPDKIPGLVADERERIIVYIATTYFYREVFEMLTEQLGIPSENIAHLPEPGISEYLLSIKRKYFTGSAAGAAEPISATAFDSAVLLPDRQSALEYMPKNVVAAEIGVAYGDFSKSILEAMTPRKFYAVDYFSQSDPYVNYFGRDDFIRDNMPHQKWYEHRFSAEIENGVMEVRQGYSWDRIAEFPDDYFDYAYLDAGHNYYSVKKDIDALARKMKDGGYIQFNDYSNGPVLANYAYGVIGAVNSFINSGEHKVRYFCLSPSGYHDIVVQVCKK